MKINDIHPHSALGAALGELGSVQAEVAALCRRLDTNAYSKLQQRHSAMLVARQDVPRDADGLPVDLDAALHADVEISALERHMLDYRPSYEAILGELRAMQPRCESAQRVVDGLRARQAYLAQQLAALEADRDDLTPNDYKRLRGVIQMELDGLTGDPSLLPLRELSFDEQQHRAFVDSLTDAEREILASGGTGADIQQLRDDRAGWRRVSPSEVGRVNGMNVFIGSRERRVLADMTAEQARSVSTARQSAQRDAEGRWRDMQRQQQRTNHTLMQQARRAR